MKNEEVLKQIEQLLSQIEDIDEQQHAIITRMFVDIFIEHNSGVRKNIDQKLYDYIDAEIQLSHSK